MKHNQTANTRLPVVIKTALLAISIAALDQITKELVRRNLEFGDHRRIIPGLDLVNVHNPGIAFGFLQDGGAIVIVFTVVALAALLAFFGTHLDYPLIWLPTGLLIGGAIGNAIDRFGQGYVTDFIKPPYWPAFNVGDTAITFGVVALLFVLQRSSRPLWSKDRGSSSDKKLEDSSGSETNTVSADIDPR